MFTVTYFYLVPLAPILDKCVPFLFLLLLFCTDIYVQCDGVGGDIYVSHIGICRPKGKGFALLWSENGYRLCSFSSGIGYGFQGNCGSVRTYFLNLLFQFQMSEKEREKLYANSKWILRKYFLLLF